MEELRYKEDEEREEKRRKAVEGVAPVMIIVHIKAGCWEGLSREIRREAASLARRGWRGKRDETQVIPRTLPVSLHL